VPGELLWSCLDLGTFLSLGSCRLFGGLSWRSPAQCLAETNIIYEVNIDYS
jgi:hypothetical protein